MAGKLTYNPRLLHHPLTILIYTERFLADMQQKRSRMLAERTETDI